MDSQRITRLRSAARIGVIASSLAAAAILLLPNVAFAATSIGSAAGNAPCAVAGYDIVQSSSSGPSYTVPAGGGVITSWSTLSGGKGFQGPANLEVWRFKSQGLYTLVGISPAQTLSATANTLDTFPANITVRAGDLLGLHVVLPMVCLQKTAAATDKIAQSSAPTPAVGGDQLLAPDFAPYHINVAAVVGASAPATNGCHKSGESKRDAKCSHDGKDTKPSDEDKTDQPPRDDRR